MTPLEQAVRRAIALHQAGDLDAAQAAYEAILKTHPRDPNVLMNLGTLYTARGRYLEAGQLLKKLIAAQPNLPQPYFGYGNVLLELGRYPEAIAQFERYLKHDPENGNAHWNLATAYLLLGDYARGLPHFEWRFASSHLQGHARAFAQPRWQGEPLDGRTLLVHAEQGFGDCLQCVRYLPMVVARGGKLVVEMLPALLRLMQASFPDITFVAAGSPLPAFELECPIMSLPLALGLTLETVPNAVPYLQVPAEHRARWAERLGPKTRRRIGLAWSGAPGHTNDKNRSLALEMLRPLLQQDIEFHSLQKEVRGRDALYVSELQFHGAELRDFADTAALVEQMDLVISVDTSVAHLAGALGRPLWLLLPSPPDYRWLLGRADSPLYPSARLFRQPERGDWASVVAAVSGALHG